MDRSDKKAIIEGVLYIWGEPLSLFDLANIIEISNEELDQLMDEMIVEFNENKRGLQIIKINDSYQLTTRPIHYEYIKKLIPKKNNKNLSNAALEILSIISYKQPITRVEIEDIRGVKSDRTISTLIERGLVEEKGRLDRTGRPIIYGTTDNFLRYFGLNSLDELPELETINVDDEDI